VQRLAALARLRAPSRRRAHLAERAGDAGPRHPHQAAAHARGTWRVSAAYCAT
jgi:hypothetical protein